MEPVAKAATNPAFVAWIRSVALDELRRLGVLVGCDCEAPERMAETPDDAARCAACDRPIPSAKQYGI